MHQSTLEKIQEVFKDKMVLGYNPNSNEIEYLTAFPIIIDQSKHAAVPKEKESDPFAWAQKYTEEFGDSQVVIVIPGSHFDFHGNRHGRGGGWYDRFLSKIPANWVRVGLTDHDHFSYIRLPKKPLDELMDWVMVKDGPVWDIYETEARKA